MYSLCNLFYLLIAVEYPVGHKLWLVDTHVGFTPGVNAGILSLKKIARVSHDNRTEAIINSDAEVQPCTINVFS